MGSASSHIGSVVSLALLGAAGGFVGGFLAGLLRRRPRTPYSQPAVSSADAAGPGATGGEG